MPDIRRVKGIAETKEGERKAVSIDVKEGDQEVIPIIELEIELAMACANKDLKLVELISTDYA